MLLNTVRLQEAFALANDIHLNDVRKGSGAPYISHPLAVAAMVLEAGGNEDHTVAALLHDTVEDHPELISIAAIRERFGDRVAAIVRGCTDSETQPKPAWCPRKSRYVTQLRTATDDVLVVASADKLHNARSINAAVRRDGLEYLDRHFTAGREGALWYVRAVADCLAARMSGETIRELVAIADELEARAGRRYDGPPCLDPCRFAASSSPQ